MTDTLITEGQARASLAAEPTAAPSSAEAFKAIAAKYGLPQADVAKTLDKHGLGQAPAAPVAPASNQNTEEVPMYRANSSGLTPAQLGTMADKLLAAGMDPATVHAAMDQEGLVQADDPRSEEELSYDRAFAGAAPHEYQINWQGLLA